MVYNYNYYTLGLEGANKETGSHKDAGFQSFETKVIYCVHY